MFEDSLVESGGKLKTRRGLTTTLSFVLQIAALGVMILIPLIYTEALPKGQLTTFLVAPPPPPPPPPPAAAVQVHKVVEVNDQVLRQPTKIPQKVAVIKDEEPPQAAAGVTGGVPGGVPGGSMGGVIGGIIGSARSNMPIAAPDRVRVSSGVASGNLINKVQPQYPPIARTNRIAGTVVLHALISKAGSIENLQVVSGHPMLTQSALEAVRQWKYKPYLLNGEPVEVETTIQVNFNLGG
jgi:periplasmic protein TonB